MFQAYLWLYLLAESLDPIEDELVETRRDGDDRRRCGMGDDRTME